MRIIPVVNGLMAGAIVAYLAYVVGYSRGMVKGFREGLDVGHRQGVFTGLFIATMRMGRDQ